jgi:hypothetical protein
VVLYESQSNVLPNFTESRAQPPIQDMSTRRIWQSPETVETRFDVIL